MNLESMLTDDFFYLLKVHNCEMNSLLADSPSLNSTDEFNWYVDNHLTVSTAFESILSSDRFETVYIDTDLAKKAANTVMQFRTKTKKQMKKLNHRLDAEFKRQLKDNYIKVESTSERRSEEKEDPTWSCTLNRVSKDHTRKVRKSTLCKRRPSEYISNIGSFLENDPKLLKSIVRIEILDNENIVDYGQSFKDDPLGLNLNDILNMNLDLIEELQLPDACEPFSRSLNDYEIGNDSSHE